MKKFTRVLAVVLMFTLLLGCLSGCKDPADQTDGTQNNGQASNLPEYTYRGYTVQLGTNWNPHTYELDYDREIMQYLQTPLVESVVKDSENGIYQWAYKAAVSVTDVTAANQGDLTKFKVVLPTGQTAEQTIEGFVFEIKLNPNMKWQDGTPINADSYIYSMKALLDPTMMNYRANLYYSGESAVAGAYNYYYSLTKDIYEAVSYADAQKLSKKDVCLDMWKLGFDKYTDASGNACPQYVSIADETIYSDAEMNVISGRKYYLDKQSEISAGNVDLYKHTVNDNYNENYKESYDSSVGCYKVDDYTIRYVTEARIDLNYFLNGLGSNWLVHEGLYEAGKDTSGKLVTTNYGTDVATTMSYGPYKIDSLQKGKQIVFVQNENHYQFTKKEDGSLYAETDYEVDGEKVQAWQTTKIVVDQMTNETAKQLFLKGELSEWTPAADEMPNYVFSDQMRQVEETYTMSLFFNTDVNALKEMDKSKGNVNSVVLSNTSFRKAFSLAIDRSDWVTATAGYKPAYALMSDMYYYDIFNDPYSTYRGTSVAKDAICKLYGVTYVNGTTYGTVEEAYASINGYNLTQAKDLMKQACAELVNKGLYTKGQEIKIKIAYSGGEMDSASQNQITKLNAYLNAAAEGSGFGTITLEGLGNIDGRHAKVVSGEYAIGYGGWGGAPFYPFRNMRVYCDPDYAAIQEGACWNPATETLTIKVDGKSVTKTWKEWSRTMLGSGEYANASVGTKLEITATMEREFLAKYYRIPLAVSCIASLQSYQVNDYTENYNIMYGFGGMELLSYNYDDAKWAAYVASVGGTLSYE